MAMGKSFQIWPYLARGSYTCRVITCLTHSRGQKQIIINKMDAIQNLYILFIQNKKKEAQLDIALVQQVPCLVTLRK